MIDRATVWAALGVFAALVAAGLGFPIPEELPIVTAGALSGHAAEPPPYKPRLLVELDEERNPARRERLAREHLDECVALLAVAPEAGFPAALPWGGLARNGEYRRPYQSPMPWWVLLPVCIAGVVISDGLLYGMGRFWGLRVLRFPWVRRLLPPDRLEKIERNFQRYGVMILLFARLLPGIRAPIFLTAGIMRLPFRKFLFADGIYAIPGVSLLFFLAYWFTDQFKDLVIRIEHRLDKAKPIIILSILLAIGVYLLIRFLRRPVPTGDPHEIPILDQVATKIEEHEAHRAGHAAPSPRPAGDPPPTS